MVKPTASIRIGGIDFGPRLFLIAGPCVIESSSHTLKMAKVIKRITSSFGIPFIFKASFDKANRTSLKSYRGPGLASGLEILRKVKEEAGVLVTSDIHCRTEVGPASRVLDVIQIPAFLCRQTDFVLEAAKTGKALNLKKAQFMAPQDMEHVVQKAASCGNRKIFLTERGSFFGYHNLVVDFRSLAIMAGLGYPVVFDATHSVQLPSHQGACSGGERQYVHGLSLAAVAFGSRGLFLEVHDRPDVAPCDGPNMIDLRGLEMLLARAKRVEEALR